MKLFVIAVALLAINPESFTCDQHYQTFIKNGTQIIDGRCYDVYVHNYPTHRVILACSP